MVLEFVVDDTIPGISIQSFRGDSPQKVISIEKDKRCARGIAKGVAEHFSNISYGTEIKETTGQYEVHVLPA